MRKSVKIMLLILAVLFIVVTAGTLFLRSWLGKTNYRKDEDVLVNEHAYESITEIASETLSETAGEAVREVLSETVAEAVSEALPETVSEKAGEVLTEAGEYVTGFRAESITGAVSEALTEKPAEVISEALSEGPAEAVSETLSERPAKAAGEALSEGSAQTAGEALSENTAESGAKVSGSSNMGYDLSEVVPVTDAQAANTYTLLVIAGATPEEENDPEKRKDADAVIIMTINHNTKEAVFYSFDTSLYVEIPRIGGGRLGNAYAIGAGPLLAETMEHNYGLHIDNYASISFKDVARIMEMPEFEKLDISRDGLAIVKELVYSLGRLKATQVTSYISELMPCVTHNLDPESLLRIILQIPKIIPYYGVEGMIPGEMEVREKDGCLVPDAGELAAYLRETLYSGVPEAKESVTESVREPEAGPAENASEAGESPAESAREEKESPAQGVTEAEESQTQNVSEPGKA